ncbi:hypothetical protein [Streptomyces sp. AP-93]|uniref:hypothetical protein n=1 Tax=Streptomyces sp. AP-93 TaxID=2929048 RepID=UPI001FAF0D1C|nr:hypothetical protein [Streptomyces sp. AP-93]MCJ0871826.1 hypothetical protein [Streptomyces sp. AP-93]
MSYGTPPVDRLADPVSTQLSTQLSTHLPAHLAVRVARLRRVVWLAVRGADPAVGRPVGPAPWATHGRNQTVPSGNRPLA